MAFFIVWIAHAELGSPFPGNFGVTLFFFFFFFFFLLSGYLITTLLRIEFSESGRISLRQFYVRRTLRIVPPFYLILGVTSALLSVGVLLGGVSFFPVLMMSLHLSNYLLIFNGFAGYPLGAFPCWSLAVEEHFYLVFPLLYLVLRRRGMTARQQASILIAICVAVLLWRMFLVVITDSAQNRTYIATDTRIDSILFGCILAVYGNPVLERNRLADASLVRVLCPLAAVVLLATFVIPGHFLRETVRCTIQGVAIAPLFVAAIRYPEWGLFRLLNRGWVRFLGGLSYTLYLVHEIVIYNVYDVVVAPWVVEAAVALAVALALATAIYYAIERPLAAVRRRHRHRVAARPRGASRPSEARATEDVGLPAG